MGEKGVVVLSGRRVVPGLALAIVGAFGVWLLLGLYHRVLPRKRNVVLAFVELVPHGKTLALEIARFDWVSGRSRTLASVPVRSTSYSEQGILGSLGKSGAWLLRMSDRRGSTHLVAVDGGGFRELHLQGKPTPATLDNAVVYNDRIIVPARSASGLLLYYYDVDGRLLYRSRLHGATDVCPAPGSLAVGMNRIAIATKPCPASRVLLYDRGGRFLADVGPGACPRLAASGTTLVYQRRPDNELIAYNTRTRRSACVNANGARPVGIAEQLLRLSSFNVVPDGHWLIVNYVNTEGIGLGLATFAVDLRSDRFEWYRLSVDLDLGIWIPVDGFGGDLSEARRNGSPEPHLAATLRGATR